MSDLWLGVALLTLVAIALIAYPWLVSSRRRQQDSLNNTQIVRQRLQELDREVQEGVLSEQDKEHAINELKLALVNESSDVHTSDTSAAKVVTIGFILCLVTGGSVYYYANQIDKIEHWQFALERLPELGRRVVVENDPSINRQDLEDFALGIRSRLLEKPGDPTGWLLLGRLYAAQERLDSAIQAFEKALNLDPGHPGALSSYGQALIFTGQEDYMRRGIRVLQQLLTVSPEDASALSMLAAAATQLGERPIALDAWQRLKAALPQDDPRIAEVDARIALLTDSDPALSEANAELSTRFIVNVALTEALQAKLPEQGYLFVFAQDAVSGNRMPAAVVKTKLSTLPIQVSLSDADAMLPDYRLSQLNQTRLVARISVDENVAQASGELEGEIVVNVEQGKVTEQQIVIDKELL